MERLGVDKLKEESIWKRKEVLDATQKLGNFIIDKNYDHTEYELLCKVFGDKNNFHLKYRKNKN